MVGVCTKGTFLCMYMHLGRQTHKTKVKHESQGSHLEPMRASQPVALRSRETTRSHTSAAAPSPRLTPRVACCTIHAAPQPEALHRGAASEARQAACTCRPARPRRGDVRRATIPSCCCCCCLRRRATPAGVRLLLCWVQHCCCCCRRWAKAPRTLCQTPSGPTSHRSTRSRSRCLHKETQPAYSNEHMSRCVQACDEAQVQVDHRQARGLGTPLPYTPPPPG